MARDLSLDTYIIQGFKRVGLATAFNGIAPGVGTQFDLSQIDLTDQEVDKSILGTPVYSNLIIEEGNYKDLKGNIITYASGNIRIDTVLFSVNLQKNIVKTQVVDRKGTVKEHISQGDYLISVNATIVGEQGRRPDALIRELRTITEVPQAITVTSNFLQLFGVSQIVIENSFVGQREGSQNIVDWSFSASSDIPLEIELLNNV